MLRGEGGGGYEKDRKAARQRKGRVMLCLTAKIRMRPERRTGTILLLIGNPIQSCLLSVFVHVCSVCACSAHTARLSFVIVHST